MASRSRCVNSQCAIAGLMFSREREQHRVSAYAHANRFSKQWLYGLPTYLPNGGMATYPADV